ncbi:MAG: Verru_Chthon cassette protein D [Verrucomicrobiaceae bacterium]
MNHTASRLPKHGYTLIELVVVMAIASLLLSLSAIGLHGTILSQKLSAAATALENDLRMMALMAVKENRSIYLRLLPQPNEPSQYHGWKFIGANPATGQWEDLSGPHMLPHGIVFMNHPDYSNILQLNPVEPATGMFFGFTRSGETTLPKTADSRWCLTLAGAADIGKKPAELPTNARTLVINAHTGSVMVY